MTLDAICLSARQEEVILPSLKNFLSVADNVILARHSQSELLNFSHPRLNVLKFQEDQNIERLLHALEASSAAHIIMCADDDFCVPSVVCHIKNFLESDTQMSTVAVQTVIAHRPSRSVLSVSPYLNSAFLQHNLEYYANFNSVNLLECIKKNFLPLSIDYYTVYNRKKLLYVVEQLVGKVKPEVHACYTGSGKVWQYILALAMLISGDIPKVHRPLYARGPAVPMRYSKSGYDAKFITPSQRLSFTQELSNFFHNHDAWIAATNALIKIYQKFGSDSPFTISHKTLSSFKLFSTLMLESLKSAQYSIQLNMLQAHEQNYKILVDPSLESGISVSKDDRLFIFRVSVGSLEEETASRDCQDFQRVWPGFLVDEHRGKDLLSLYHVSM